jgi:VWFA-related protein
MVFDKQGHFVDGLQREQFELSIDGKPQAISFFEQVRAGSSKEQALKLNSNSTAAAPSEKPTLVNENPGRIIVFFLDDLHLSLDSLTRTHKMLTQFIENEMDDNDRVAIASTSGDIGFLQQFTDNKSVLHAAVGRLRQHPYNVRDMTRESTPMTEYMALTIERKDDPGVFAFYVDECLRVAPPRYPRRSCEVEVVNRARLILVQAAAVIVNTYESLESLMRTSAQMLGRKLVCSLLPGLQNVKSKETKGSAAGIPQVQFSTDHHFARNSRLRFITFIYNAARGQTGNSPPNISLQARVLRAGQVVKSSPMQQVSVAAQDFARIPYGVKSHSTPCRQANTFYR